MSVCSVCARRTNHGVVESIKEIAEPLPEDLRPLRQVELIPIKAHQILKYVRQPSGSRTLDHKTADDVVRAYDFDETSSDHFHERPVVNVAKFADHMCHILLCNPVLFGVPHKHAAQTQNLSDLLKKIPANHVSSFS